jgi:hypothetical protein
LNVNVIFVEHDANNGDIGTKFLPQDVSSNCVLFSSLWLIDSAQWVHYLRNEGNRTIPGIG